MRVAGLRLDDRREADGIMHMPTGQSGHPLSLGAGADARALMPSRETRRSVWAKFTKT